ncbi:MAG: serine hydrolase domain-containing protein [Alphaproteobacteria bacterium]|nr:serine hydrolase domain-containing protein [Alphaproteobacteria bacterium]
MITNISMNSGATLQIPDGFQIQKLDQENKRIKLESPEKDMNIFLIESKGSNLKHAIEDAWKSVIPKFDHKIAQTMEPPSPSGYDAFLIQNYEADKETFIQALAQRKNDTIWAFLISGPAATVHKRNSQILSFLSSLKIPDMIIEDLTAKPLKSIKENIGQFNQSIVQAMRKLDVPGISIAIVENGEIVFEKGYGVKKWGEQDHINEHTLMKIGSISKSMTTLLMAKLIEEGKFKWCTKVQEIYPDFQVDDDVLSKTFVMEQLASGSTGMPRKDLPMILNYKSKDVFQQLATTKPTTESKETFQYNNQMITAVGYVSAHAVYPKKSMDQAFCDLMVEKVFEPMGMIQTTFTPIENFALPHSKTIDGKVQFLSLQDDEFSDFQKPAGGIWSSAHDMALYLITELQNGINPFGKRIFDKQNLMYRRIPQIKLGHDSYYGLGWGLTKPKGINCIRHGGGTFGFKSMLRFYPDKKCGFIILTNGVAGDFLHDYISSKILELWFDTNEKSSELLEHYSQLSDNQDIEFKEKLSEPKAEWMRPFLGKYQNDELGVFKIKQDQGNYIFDMGVYKTKLMMHEEKNGENTLGFIMSPFTGFTLIPMEGGSFKMIEGQHDYVFKKLH